MKKGLKALPLYKIMKAFHEFLTKEPAFWAYVKFISEKLGYTQRGSGNLKRYTVDEVSECLKSNGLSPLTLKDSKFELTEVIDYLNKRANLLEKDIAPLLMNREEAKKEFEKLTSQYKHTCHLPFNKQKGDKRHYAYLTCIINILTEMTLKSCEFDDNPRGLTIATKEGKIVKTLSRWMDGAYPSKLNPLAIWEIKEYYGTTTFGSRVADGVYETMLDGMELKELEKEHGIKIMHFLVIDDKFTWWSCGKSYLCRIIDSLNMGLIDEALFGKEVITQWPKIIHQLSKRRS